MDFLKNLKYYQKIFNYPQNVRKRKKHLISTFFLFFRNKKEACYAGIVVPKGKKYMCRQKFVRITLKALNEENTVFDDLFYYPSHCVCELVNIKSKTRKPKTRKPKCFRT